MPSYVDQPSDYVRKDPLGPVAVNQAQQNVEVIDGYTLHEHFEDGQHNAQEIPWVLGHVTSGTTGYLFDTAYGGGSISRPATGECTVSVDSSVMGYADTANGGSELAASIIGNVSDSDIANTPHLITSEIVSTTSIKTRVRRLTSTLGSPGNAWESVARAFDVALHAQKQPIEESTLAPATLKRRRDFLTQAATDWNALVGNQAIVRRRMMLEHTSAGVHNVNRIARAVGWFKPAAGPSFSLTLGDGIDSVSRVSAGVVEVTLSSALSSTDLAACFCQAQPVDDDELVIINGRCTTVSKFRFYIYGYSVSENKWDRADRPFFASFFGTPA